MLQNGYKNALKFKHQWKSAIFGRFLRWKHFPGRGMVMDENGRNGRNWHLAQQITEPVITYILSKTTNQILLLHTLAQLKNQSNNFNCT